MQLLYSTSKVTMDSGRKWLTFVLKLCPVTLLVPAACPTLTSQCGLVLWPDCSWQSQIFSLWTPGMSTIWIYFFFLADSQILARGTVSHGQVSPTLTSGLAGGLPSSAQDPVLPLKSCLCFPPGFLQAFVFSPATLCPLLSFFVVCTHSSFCPPPQRFSPRESHKCQGYQHMSIIPELKMLG